MKFNLENAQLTLNIEPNFREKMEAGWEGDCPCCGRFSKIYERPLHSGMARQLISLYRKSKPGQFLHIKHFCDVGTGTDIPFTRFWGLVEAEANTEKKKKTSGIWRLTEKGRLYVEGSYKIIKYCHVFDNRVVKFSGDLVDIKSALSNAFDYQELFNGN